MKKILLTLGLIISGGQITAMEYLNNNGVRASLLIASNILILQHNNHQERLLQSTIERYPESHVRLEYLSRKHQMVMWMPIILVGLSGKNMLTGNYEKASYYAALATATTIGREIAIRYAIDHLE